MMFGRSIKRTGQTVTEAELGLLGQLAVHRLLVSSLLCPLLRQRAKAEAWLSLPGSATAADLCLLSQLLAHDLA